MTITVSPPHNEALGNSCGIHRDMNTDHELEEAMKVAALRETVLQFFVDNKTPSAPSSPNLSRAFRSISPMPTKIINPLSLSAPLTRDQFSAPSTPINTPTSKSRPSTPSSSIPSSSTPINIPTSKSRPSTPSSSFSTTPSQTSTSSFFTPTSFSSMPSSSATPVAAYPLTPSRSCPATPAPHGPSPSLLKRFYDLIKYVNVPDVLHGLENFGYLSADQSIELFECVMQLKKDFPELAKILQYGEADRPICTVQHKGVTCNSCFATDIRGTRYKCAICPDYDMCEQCERKGILTHDITHPRIKMLVPSECTFEHTCKLHNSQGEKNESCPHLVKRSISPASTPVSTYEKRQAQFTTLMQRKQARETMRQMYIEEEARQREEEERLKREEEEEQRKEEQGKSILWGYFDNLKKQNKLQIIDTHATSSFSSISSVSSVSSQSSTSESASAVSSTTSSESASESTPETASVVSSISSTSSALSSVSSNVSASLPIAVSGNLVVSTSSIVADFNMVSNANSRPSSPLALSPVITPASPVSSSIPSPAVSSSLSSPISSIPTPSSPVCSPIPSPRRPRALRPGLMPSSRIQNQKLAVFESPVTSPLFAKVSLNSSLEDSKLRVSSEQEESEEEYESYETESDVESSPDFLAGVLRDIGLKSSTSSQQSDDSSSTPKKNSSFFSSLRDLLK